MYHLMHDVLAGRTPCSATRAPSSRSPATASWRCLGRRWREDHARRAVLAALELRQRLRVPDAIRGQPHGVAVRLGLHTGPVVVGRWRTSRSGPTPRRATPSPGHTAPAAAARPTPSSSAPPPMRWCRTRSRARRARPSCSMGRPPRCLCTRSAASCGGGRASHGAAHGPESLCGSHPGTGAAARAAGAGARRAGQVIGIAGEPGLGKSRLLAEFVHSLRGRPVTCCEGHCLAYGRATPYLPVRDLLRQLWNLPEPAPATAITATVHQRLREAGVTSEDEALCCSSSWTCPWTWRRGRAGPAGAPGADLCIAVARDPAGQSAAALLLAVENLHWIDPTSEEWLAALVERLGDTPVLLLATYRPGISRPGSGTRRRPRWRCRGCRPRQPGGAAVRAAGRTAPRACARGDCGQSGRQSLLCGGVDLGGRGARRPRRHCRCRTPSRRCWRRA